MYFSILESDFCGAKYAVSNIQLPMFDQYKLYE